jgi:hypothetical protein
VPGGARLRSLYIQRWVQLGDQLPLQRDRFGEFGPGEGEVLVHPAGEALFVLGDQDDTAKNECGLDH